MKRSYLLSSLAALALGVLAITASPTGAMVDEMSVGLRIGERIPAGFRAEDETGKPRDFASLKGERGLILLFTRSLDW